MPAWPPRIELCAFVQDHLARIVSDGAAIDGELVMALRQRWPHLDASTALHLARLGRRTDWDPEPRPEPRRPHRTKDTLFPPVTLRHIVETGARHLAPHCGRCTHTSPIPLEILLRRFGDAISLDLLLPVFVCSWCQGRAHSLTDDRPPARGTGRR